MKTCFKCKQLLPITDFYQHDAMTSGTLGKCKECTKRDVRDNYRRNRDHYRKYEQARFKDPARKLNLARYMKRMRELHPEKYKARVMLNNAVRDGRITPGPCEMCGETRGVQAHHDDYFKPLDVNWLCFKCHRTHKHGQEVA